MSYHEKLKYQAEKNWADNVHELHGKYNLPLNDENVCNLTYAMCEKMVHDRVKYVAFFSLTEICSANKRLAFYHMINSLKHHTLQVLCQKLLTWCLEQELVSMISNTTLRKGMKRYPGPFVDNLLGSLSTCSSATQGFFVRIP